MPVKTEFKISSPEGVSYVCREGDPFYRLKKTMEKFSEAERLLPLGLIINPEAQMAPHYQDRQRLVERIQHYGAKLETEALVELVAKLRRLVLADWFTEQFYANVNVNEGAPGTQERAGTGHQPVFEDAPGGQHEGAGGDDGGGAGFDGRFEAAPQ